jgi:23S rRNA (cytidine1920-2'-O)/16S rRNA (cytidine1409-2'-O)-methyltransferase
MRADQLMHARGLAPTRSAARRLIAAGAVQCLAAGAWVVCAKAGEELALDAQLRITDDAELRWASRGGLKLDGALAHIGLDVTGLTCLDAGQSTGGFTDVLLARGAASVVGFDVGHGQLSGRLRKDSRVVALEGLHVRELAGSALASHAPEGGFDMLVADLSFISLAGALMHLAPWLKPGCDAVLLAKPQFEVGRAHVGKGGLVRDTAQLKRVEVIFREACAAVQWSVRDYFASPVTGGDGNPESFVWAQALLARTDAAESASARCAAADPAPTSQSRTLETT